MALIILPGVNSGAYLFEGAKAALKGTEVVLFDPPGVSGPQGKAPMLPMGLPFTTAQYAREVLRYMDLHNLWQVDVLGHSMGGYAAQELAHLAPQRVNKLVLVSTSAGQPATTRDVGAMPGKLKKSFWEINQLIERDPMEGMKPMFGARFLSHHPHEYEAFVKARSAHLPGSTVSLSHLAAGGAFSSRRWVHKLEMSALVLQGSDDVLVSAASGHDLAAHLPNAHLIELHGVGHFPMLEHPDFWRYVKDFLAGNGAGHKVAPSPSHTVWSKIKEILTRHG